MQKLMKRFHKNQKGFTLVELMVVVVIIGILVAIAIPIYGLITERAEQSTVEANLRTIDSAVLMYQATYDSNVSPELADLENDFIEPVESVNTENYRVNESRAEVGNGSAGGQDWDASTWDSLPVDWEN